MVVISCYHAGCVFGLCGVLLQAGAWDTDDTGLEYMPNKAVAEAIQQKVLKMYIVDGLISTGLLAAFYFI